MSSGPHTRRRVRRRGTSRTRNGRRPDPRARFSDCRNPSPSSSPPPEPPMTTGPWSVVRWRHRNQATGNRRGKQITGRCSSQAKSLSCMCEFFELYNECETIPFREESQTTLEVRRRISLPSCALTVATGTEPQETPPTPCSFHPAGTSPGVPSFERIHRT